MVLLIGNYLPDRQESMLRFNQMMLSGLSAANCPHRMIRPPAVFGRFTLLGNGVAKWLGYIDKFILFPVRLRLALLRRPALVHICDHSNAPYAPTVRSCPVVITCHDMLAVRGGLGEATDTPASPTGVVLQQWILRGLQAARAIACISEATAADVRRLVSPVSPQTRVTVVPVGLSYPYRVIERPEAIRRLENMSPLDPAKPFLLHVGSNLRRKNREAILRIAALCAKEWDIQVVFAGQPLNPALQREADRLGLGPRIINAPQPSNELLEALYNCASALVYPSRFEGFGWPIIEAQACGCPVVCSSAQPMAWVAGEGALLNDPEDDEGFARNLLLLRHPQQRELWSSKAVANAARFSASRMIEQYLELYRSVVPAAC